MTERKRNAKRIKRGTSDFKSCRRRKRTKNTKKDKKR